MLDFINKNYYIILLVLIALLILLVILKKITIEKINKENLHIEKASFIGREEIQEDYLDVVKSSQGTLAVLADGLGKNEAGRISSIITVKTFTRLFLKQEDDKKIEYFFNRAFNTANNEILKRVDNNQGGASVASVVVIEDLLYYALLGDTVISVFRNGELFKLSEGHTINVLAKKGFYKGKISRESALQALKEKKLLYYLGQETLREYESSETPVKLKEGDIILLMSRGIYEGLTWTQLEEVFNENRNLKSLCNEIIQCIKNSNRNRHNGSIILMKYM